MGPKNTELSQRASQNRINQSMDSVNPSLSMGLNLKCQNANQTAKQTLRDSSYALYLIELTNRKWFHGHITWSLHDFIHVKYHSTDIEEEHRVESMNRYHMVNKHFCKIQRQVSKYSTMEIGHSVDYQHVHTVVFFHL